MDEYRELFLSEANEYLQILNNCLLKMEKDPENLENLQEMFRIVHSLKGMAGTMGYELLTQVSHRLEFYLEKLKSGEFSVTAETIDLLFDSVDVFQGLIIFPEAPEEKEKTAATRLLEKLERHLQKNGEPGMETPVPSTDDEEAPVTFDFNAEEKEFLSAARTRGEFTYLVRVILHRETMMKSVRSYMVIRALEDFGEIVSTEPSMEDLDEEKFDCSFKVAIVSPSLSMRKVEEGLLKIADVEKVEVVEAPDIKPVSTEEDIDQTPGARDDRPRDKERTLARKEKTTGPEAPKPVSRTGLIEKTVRVETAKLDELINLIGEMVITRNSVLEKGTGLREDLDHSLEQMERIITNLQDVAMKLRMVPIKQVFERFPRMVRDISRESGKDIQIEISGEETELDRSIINQLPDPLVHLLRNAIDHGIEDIDERIAGGKDRTGKIKLKAFHESSYVVIMVEDDGRGIDPESIEKAALEKGIASEDELSRMSEQEILNLIFYSGFSTSSTVTQVSGRGVGLDAVKYNIESMRGSIEIKSEVNRGTKFILRFPLTFAIIKALLVRTGEQIFAIPIESIRENVFIKSHQIKSIQKKRVIDIRGEVISLYDLGSLLDTSVESPEGVSEYPVVIIEVGDRKAGFMVEQLIGQQEIVIKSLGHYLQGIKGITGATVLGDGRVTLILDIIGLLEDRRVEVG
ncbi:MAG: chemotaxis protein CheA [Firmicutes bacterium]|jgi:two-component system chemotaxis sensor kinase CheA|nr:chemotaxis protein CheA [Bacillota bacterium]